MSVRAARGHAALRAFIHTSSRSCSAAVLLKTRPGLYSPKDAPPPAPSEPTLEELASQPYEISVHGDFIHRLLPDKRSGKLVTYIFPRPNFSLVSHPLTTHPCVSGLGLDHGTLAPFKPIPTWQIIKSKRAEQRALAAANGETSPCNVLLPTLRLWAAFWGEHSRHENISRIYQLPQYEQPVTYVGIKGAKAPKFARGPNSVLLTCFLSHYHVADPDLELNELGVPAHVTDLLFALPVKALNSGTPDIPTITRISPSQYVLTFKSRGARTALLSAWAEYVPSVEEHVGRVPPYTLEPDTEHAPAHEPAPAPAPASAPPRTAENASQTLDARRDVRGGVWLGGDRYTRVEDLPKLLFDRAKRDATALAASAKGPAAPAPVERRKERNAPAKSLPRPPRGHVVEPSNMWSMPPDLSKLLS